MGRTRRWLPAKPWCALLLLLPSPALAAPAEAEPPALVTCVARFFAANPVSDRGQWALGTDGGVRVPMGDGTVRTQTERADTPTLRDLFTPAYQPGPIALPDGDPGRIRSEALMAATYGASEREVSRALVPWNFHGQRFSVHRRALPAFDAVGARLEHLIRAQPLVAPLFDHMGGTFNWRAIAGTRRRSAHAYGIAVDLNPQLADYWRNASPLRLGRPKESIPVDVINAFEAEGFIWGGRWSHYDTMHFEWRPELFACTKLLPPVQPVWSYPWLGDPDPQATKIDGDLEHRFEAPAGFQRVSLLPESFGSFLRSLPMAPTGTPVVSFRGELLYQDATGDIVAGVTALDIGHGDLQQCADSVIRLHAEWLWALGFRSHRYTTLSGTTLSLADYLSGVRVRPKGSHLITERSAAAAPATRAAFRGYLDEVFEWANTASIRREGTPVAFREIAPGDFFVMEGKPWGHAVLVVDAARSADGRVALLLGEGAIPAESFHILRRDAASSPWFILEPGAATLETPVWDPFPESALRRLPVPPSTED